MANTNVVNFNDAVLQRQRSNSASNTSMSIAANDDKIKEIAIVNNKQLVGQESMTKTLLEIKKTLENISKTLETNLAITLKGASPNVGSAIAAGTEETENQEESDKRKKDSSDLQEKLLQNIVSGITGLAKITNDKLGKLGELYKEGANSGGDQSMFGRMKGGLGNIYNKGKGFVSGIGNKLSAAKDAFKSGREAGGVSRGLGRAFSSLRGPTGGTTVPGFNRAPGSFGTGNWNTGPIRGPAMPAGVPSGAPGMASRVVGTAVEAGTAAEAGGGLLAGAGRMLATPLAGAAAIGLAGFGVYNDITGNIDKSNDIEASRDSGALTGDQANVLQGESLGDTAGTTAGALIGGIAGSALGPLGTAAGAWLGSKAGGFIGGTAGKYGVKAYQGMKSMLGFGDTEEEKAAKLTPEQKNMQDFASGKIDADTYNENMKNQVEGTQPETAITKQTVSGNDLMVPPVDNTPVTTAASLAPGEEIVPASNIVAVPTQTPSEAKGTGVWDSMKSMGASALGGIKSGANWVGDKASELGTGISDWFGETGVGRAWNDRNANVGDLRATERGSTESLVGGKTELSTTEDSTGITEQLNEGITNEKSALGSSWLGRLMAGKGTRTEQFLAESSTSGSNPDGSNKDFKYSSSLGERKSGGWFGKDEYTLTDPTTGEPVTVDKSTYMKAKSISEKGGDAGEIGGLIKKDQEAKNAAMAPAGNTAMGDYGGDYDNSSIVDDGTPTVRPKAAGASNAPGVDVRQGLTEQQYTDITSMQGNKYKTTMTDESGKEITGDQERIAAYKKGRDAMNSQLSGSLSANPTPGTAPRGDNLYASSSETADAKEDAANKGTGGTAVINAPTNVNNTTQNATITKSPAKNPEPSLSRYLGTKYGAF